MSNSICRVVATTTNPAKTKAISDAIRYLCKPQLITINVNRWLRVKQPIGSLQLFCCALKRIVAAQSILKESNYELIVAIEAGIVYLEEQAFEGQLAIIADREGKLTLGLSPLFPIPLKWLNRLEKGIELEELVVSQTRIRQIGERIGFIGYLTGGILTRTELSYLAILNALLPWINQDIYRDSYQSLHRLYGKLNCSETC